MKTRHAFTLVELLVVIAIIGVLVALLLPAVQAAREAARRSQCSNNLRQLAIALQNHHSAHGMFPTGAVIPNAAQPRTHASNRGFNISWHARVLPFIEQQPLFQQIDWQAGYESGNKNHGLTRTPVDAFFCPSSTDDMHKSVFVSSLYNGETTYTQQYNGVSGPLFNPAVGINAYSDPVDGMIRDDKIHSACAGSGRLGFAKMGVLFPGSEIKMSHIGDGTSNTFAIAERNMGETTWIAGLSNAFGWPCDAAGFKNLQFGINLCREDNPGADNHCVIYGNSRPFSSMHPSGCQFAYCDASVAFISDDTDLSILQALATRDYGELNTQAR